MFGVVVFVFFIYLILPSGGGPKNPDTSTTSTIPKADAFPAHSPLNPDWKGSGKPVVFGFGGDVHFAGAVGTRLAQHPSTALGPTISQLFLGAQLKMVNLETAVTSSGCPDPQPKPYIFDAPPTALSALGDAGITLATQANDHGLDCGQGGLTQNLAIATASKYPIIGIGSNATQAFTPFLAKVNGQRIAIFSATQIIAPNLVATWEATSTQGGVASAIDPTQLVDAVQKARRAVDTIVVYLHWGTETQACPNPQQEPLAEQLVTAGADIVVGTNAHVLLGAGYLGSAYVSYGLGNFAFYDDAAPETSSGSLIITAVGRQISNATFRPATILAGLPQPLTGAPAANALQSWNAARSCTNLSSAPSTSLATMRGETSTFVAPAAPATTTTTAAGATTGNSGTTTTSSTASAAAATTTTTAPAPTTTAPTDNAG